MSCKALKLVVLVTAFHMQSCKSVNHQGSTLKDAETESPSGASGDTSATCPAPSTDAVLPSGDQPTDGSSLRLTDSATCRTGSTSPCDQAACGNDGKATSAACGKTVTTWADASSGAADVRSAYNKCAADLHSASEIHQWAEEFGALFSLYSGAAELLPNILAEAGVKSLESLGTKSLEKRVEVLTEMCDELLQKAKNLESCMNCYSSYATGAARQCYCDASLDESATNFRPSGMERCSLCGWNTNQFDSRQTANCDGRTAPPPPTPAPAPEYDRWRCTISWRYQLKYTNDRGAHFSDETPVNSSTPCTFEVTDSAATDATAENKESTRAAGKAACLASQQIQIDVADAQHNLDIYRRAVTPGGRCADSVPDGDTSKVTCTKVHTSVAPSCPSS